MRKFALLGATAAAFLAVPAIAQDMSAPADPAATAAPADPAATAAPADPAATAAPAPTYEQTADTTDTGPKAPDGTRAFGFDPYVGVMGGWEQFDNERNPAGIPQTLNADGSVNRRYKLAGALVQGVVGFNIPLGPVFVGAEGNATKGVSGDIDWEYGAAGRFGFRAGESGLFYGKVGYQWVNFDKFGNDSRDYNDITYGIGAEFGPKDIGLSGLTGNAGFRIRTEVSTFGAAHSFRPMMGLVTHF